MDIKLYKKFYQYVKIRKQKFSYYGYAYYFRPKIVFCSLKFSNIYNKILITKILLAI